MGEYLAIYIKALWWPCKAAVLLLFIHCIVRCSWFCGVVLSVVFNANIWSFNIKAPGGLGC